MNEGRWRKLGAYLSKLSAPETKRLVKQAVDLANQSGKIRLVASNENPPAESPRPVLPPSR
jgi:hypothetical protein